MPRGRWYLKLRATSRTPLASSAEASVSPGWPSYSRPSKRKRSTRLRSMRPPLARRMRLRHRRRATRRAGLADPVDREDAVRDRVAQQVEPAAAAGAVHPALGEDAPRVVRACTGNRPRRRHRARPGRRARDMRLAAVAELDLVALRRTRGRGSAACTSSMRHRRRAVLVDQRAGREAVERERRRERVRLVVGDRVGEDLAGARRRLEPAGAPAAVEIEPRRPAACR